MLFFVGFLAGRIVTKRLSVAATSQIKKGRYPLVFYQLHFAVFYTQIFQITCSLYCNFFAFIFLCESVRSRSSAPANRFFLFSSSAIKKTAGKNRLIFFLNVRPDGNPST